MTYKIIKLELLKTVVTDNGKFKGSCYSMAWKNLTKYVKVVDKLLPGNATEDLRKDIIAELVKTDFLNYSKGNAE